DWKICLENGNSLIFEDNFFNRFKNDLEYLSSENIPQNIEYICNQFAPEDNTPILFGSKNLYIDNNEIRCGMDIFASSFFMLVRWEEYVNKKRDKHDRFVAKESVAFKNNFLHRPIVNEYIEMLKNMMLYLDKSLKFKQHDSKFFVSCDVDEPFDPTVKNIQILIRTCVGDLIKRKSFSICINRIKRYIFNKIGNYKYDENYTFDWYMDICEKAKLKASFYFIPYNLEPGNGSYSLNDKKIQELIVKIYKRGHEIGVHGSYQTYLDKEKAKAQKNMLENILKEVNICQNIAGNRQHYLRWDSSATPSVLEYCNFDYDTTGGYADVCGFRYGICYEFSMFDFIDRKKLKLKQRPLVVMECTVMDEQYMNIKNTNDVSAAILALKNKCFKYNGNFSLLWHNSRLRTVLEKDIFKQIVLNISPNNC
ncbi:MAG: polysaccharide deacetylase family protein, partial [Bacteroidota bacterium]|nr:polysaccharide deacetylase family protein [Bacteroidota bacterium]